MMTSKDASAQLGLCEIVLHSKPLPENVRVTIEQVAAFGGMLDENNRFKEMTTHTKYLANIWLANPNLIEQAECDEFYRSMEALTQPSLVPTLLKRQAS